PRLTTYATNGQHHTLPQVDREFLHRQLLEAQAAITAVLGAPPSPLWRAPYGEYNRQILGWAAELGLIHVDWTRNGRQSLDALDWVHDPQSPSYLPAEALARRLVAAMDAQPGGGAGAIVLMPLASRRPEPPLLLALPLLLDELDRKGLRPIPVGELLRPQLTKCGENATPWAMAPP
ncbi:MAG: polysaccharide deacetylase family protein, partial [Thermoanaerobaculum sp.]|nr:polysaccharide deacetylase family protein [Thermoanaerobaculum sp.]MDW7967524.1 polysaccharide deacetylase family protein [Thermoanaerobaculum sp.]